MDNCGSSRATTCFQAAPLRAEAVWHVAVRRRRRITPSPRCIAAKLEELDVSEQLSCLSWIREAKSSNSALCGRNGPCSVCIMRKSGTRRGDLWIFLDSQRYKSPKKASAMLGSIILQLATPLPVPSHRGGNGNGESVTLKLASNGGLSQLTLLFWLYQVVEKRVMVNALSKEKGLLQQQLRELQQRFEEQQEPFPAAFAALSEAVGGGTGAGLAAKLHRGAARPAGASPASGASCSSRCSHARAYTDLRTHLGALRGTGTALAQCHGRAGAAGLSAPPAEGDAVSLGLPWP